MIQLRCPISGSICPSRVCHSGGDCCANAARPLIMESDVNREKIALAVPIIRSLLLTSLRFMRAPTKDKARFRSSRRAGPYRPPRYCAGSVKSSPSAASARRPRQSPSRSAIHQSSYSGPGHRCQERRSREHHRHEEAGHEDSPQANPAGKSNANGYQDNIHQAVKPHHRAGLT